MAPAFVYCIATCNPPNPACTSPSALDTLVHQTWRQTLDGTEYLTSTLLAEWNMASKSVVENGTCQVFIYTCPCGLALETALGISIQRAELNVRMFHEEVQSGRSFPQLPCRIRVDDRLVGHGCGAEDSLLERMESLRDYLKACASNSRGIPGMERLQLTPLHSGPWLAMHFDVPYLDQCCYRLAQAAGRSVGEDMVLSMVDVMARMPNPQFTTGHLAIADAEGSQGFIKFSDTSAEASTLTVRPEEVHRLDPVGQGSWLASFYGTFHMVRPKSFAQQMEEDQRERERQREEYKRLAEGHQKG